MATSPLLWDWDIRHSHVEWNENAAIDDLLLAEALDTEEAWLSSISDGDRQHVRRARASAFDASKGAASHWSSTYGLRTGGERPVLVRERGSVAHDPSGRPFRAAGMLEVVDADIASRTVPGPPRLSEAQLGLFFDWLPQLAWSTTPDGWIDFYNDRWYAYTGSTFEEMEGWGWIRVHDPDDLTRIIRVYRQAFVGGQPWEDEFRLRRASDGMMRWHLSRAMPVRDESGKIVRWFGTNTDIHDQKLAAAEHARLLSRAERARADAEAANKAKDDFLAMVSHELRTPLNAVLGWAQLLRSGAVEPSRTELALGKVESNARIQARLIDDLVDVSRIIGEKLTIGRAPVDLESILQLAVDTVRPAAAEGHVEIEFTRRADCATVLGARERLVQVFGNLLTNALKFGRSGGRIEIAVTSDATQVATSIHDYGIGIERDQLTHLFDPFWQANTSSTRRHGGLGLGLTIASKLVELHGGTLCAESDGAGKGATFTVVLPRAREAAPLTSPDDIDPISLVGIHVLAVDDEPSAREVLANALLSCGATVSTAASVSEALRALRSASFDVVISDIAMPEVDGYELVRRAREVPGYERLPMIALTAYASYADRTRAASAGFDLHLAKPIDVRAVARCVSQLVASDVVCERSRPGPNCVEYSAPATVGVRS
ncbi:MAG TPA: ATP-binding protein [Labilithrix sp.]|nr:ATP-binding protein [Labilithrix sp.]